jgi:hypothetical protein
MNRQTKTTWTALLILLGISSASCVGVRRELTVESEPSGALVYLNDEEVGRTPLTHEFIYYGTMDLKLRKQGFETLEDQPKVWAPWWQIPPIDLVAEAFPLTDRHKLSYELTPREQGAPPEELVRRGVELRGKLESSQLPARRAAQTQPAPPQPGTQPAQ